MRNNFKVATVSTEQRFIQRITKKGAVRIPLITTTFHAGSYNILQYHPSDSGDSNLARLIPAF